jgi:cellulose synthase operon protein C
LRPSVDLALRSFAAAKQAGRPQPEAALLGWSEGNPGDSRANFALGTVALESNDRDAAVRRYESVLEADPAHVGALNNLAWLYSESGDERALGLAERAYAAQPNDPSVADTLGWLRVQRGDAAAGLPLLQSAAAALAQNPEVRYHWAVALAETGDSRQAVAELTALLRGDNEFASREAARQRLADLQAGNAR